MGMTHIRYIPGTPPAKQFPTVRYPWTRELSRDEAEALLSRMPDPSRFEIVEED